MRYEAGAPWGVAAVLAVAVCALALAVVWLLADRRRTTRRRQTERDLLDENLVHAMAELVLRQDALTREVRRALDGARGPDDEGTHEA